MIQWSGIIINPVVGIYIVFKTIRSILQKNACEFIGLVVFFYIFINSYVVLLDIFIHYEYITDL